MSDIIDIYYANKKEIRNDNKKIFIYDNENIDSEKNKDKKIKDYLIDSNKKDLNISVFEKRKMKQINYKEGGYLIFELYLPNDKKVSDLIELYYKKKNIKNENKKYFLFDGDIMNHYKNKYIRDIEKDIPVLEVLVE